MKPATRTLLAALTVIAACSSPPEGVRSTDPSGGLVVSPGIDTVLVADTVRFAVLVDSLPVTSGPVSWTLSDSRVATMEAQAGGSALVRAIHQGTTTVTAAQAGHTASAVLVAVDLKLAFTAQPRNVAAGYSLTPGVAVTIENASGPVPSATNEVTIAIRTNPGGATLAGTTSVAAVNGVATFSNLSVDKPGAGYTLVATATGLPSAGSAAFDVAAFPGLSFDQTGNVLFGNQTLNATSAPRIVTLINTTDSAAALVSISTGGFSFTDYAATPDCPAQLAARTSCKISIAFTPSVTGTRTGLLVINGDLVWLGLSGTGTGGLSVALAPDPSGKFGKFAYVANSQSDNVSMYSINAGTGALTPIAPGRIAAGTKPVSLAVDPSGRFAYVANSGSNDVSMFTIDPNTGALTPIGSPVPAGSSPVSVAVAPDPSGRFGTFAYVANSGSNDVSMFTIDPNTGALTPIGSPVPAALSPISVAVHPSGKFAYVATDGCEQGGNHYVNSCVLKYAINATSGTLAALLPDQTTGAWSPTSVAIDPSGTFAALTNGGSNDVWMYVIDATTGALTLTSAWYDARSPTAVAIDPAGRFAYVTSAGLGNSSPPCPTLWGCSNLVSIYSIGAGGSLTPPGTIAAGSSPTSIAIDPSGKFAYVANFGSRSVSTYSIGTGGVLTLIGTIGT